MLSLRDCLDMADVSEAEIAAIARHKNIPHLLALAFGQELMQTPQGVELLQQFIVDDIKAAQAQHRCRDCEGFSRTLTAFLDKQRTAKVYEEGQLEELLAVGRVRESETLEQELRGAKAGLVRRVLRAKRGSDCCACVQLSLELSE